MASPNDTSEERQIYTEVVESINRSRGESDSFHLEPIKWESYAYPEAGDPQGTINRLLEDAELVIILFWNKIGAPTKNFPSGTMEEFSIAYEKFTKTGKPSIKIYFRKPSAPKSKSDAEEHKKLFDFKESIRDLALYKDYESPENFRTLLYEHIGGWLSKRIDRNAKLEDRRALSEPSDGKSIVKEVFEKIGQKYDGEKSRLSFGIKMLDEVVGEIEEKSLILVAGHMGSGKTALMITLMNQVSVRNGVPALFFSMRSNKLEIMQKLLSNVSYVDIDRLKKGMITKEDWAKMTSAAGRLVDAPLFIDDNPEMTLKDLKTQVDRFQKSHKIGLVILDGLSYLSGEDGKVGYRMRILSRQLQIPIIATVQLDIPKRISIRPTLNDLDLFGDLKTEADVIVFLDKPLQGDWDQEAGYRDAIIAKNSGGPLDKCGIILMPQYCVFIDRLFIEHPDEKKQTTKNNENGLSQT